MKIKLIAIGLISILMLTTASNSVSADDNETVKERLYSVIKDLIIYQNNLFEEIIRLVDEEGYLPTDSAIKALEKAATDFTEPIRDLFDVLNSIDVKKNKDVKADLYEVIQDITQNQDYIFEIWVALVNGQGYLPSEPVIQALADAATGLNEYILTLYDIYHSIEEKSRRTSFNGILAKIFDNYPILSLLIKLLFKL